MLVVYKEQGKKWGTVGACDGCNDSGRNPLINFTNNTPAGNVAWLSTAKLADCASKALLLKKISSYHLGAGSFFLGATDTTGKTKDAAYMLKLMCNAVEKMGADQTFAMITDSAAANMLDNLLEAK
jgi:hypothetical protein